MLCFGLVCLFILHGVHQAFLFTDFIVFFKLGKNLANTFFSHYFFGWMFFLPPVVGTAAMVISQTASGDPRFPRARFAYFSDFFLLCFILLRLWCVVRSSGLLCRVWSAGVISREVTADAVFLFPSPLGYVPSPRASLSVPYTSPVFTFPLNICSAVIAVFNIHSLQVPSSPSFMGVSLIFLLMDSPDFLHISLFWSRYFE